MASSCPPLVATLVAAAIVPAPPAAAAAERWAWPVRGEVRSAFRTGPDPFARGQHRGVDVASRAEAPVAAPCAGTIRFAGPLPGRGHGVTIACGDLVATVLELRAVRVRRGKAVGRGARIGVASGTPVHLGARRAGRPHGYVDPLALLEEDGPPPFGPAPPTALRRAPRLPAPAPAEAPRLLPARPDAALVPAGTPAVAWAGLVLLLGAMGAGAAIRRDATRRARRAARLAADAKPRTTAR